MQTRRSIGNCNAPKHIAKHVHNVTTHEYVPKCLTITADIKRDELYLPIASDHRHKCCMHLTTLEQFRHILPS